MATPQMDELSPSRLVSSSCLRLSNSDLSVCFCLLGFSSLISSYSEHL